MKITYDLIKPILISATIHADNEVKCVFQAENMEPVKTSAFPTYNQTKGTITALKQGGRDTVIYSVIGFFTSMLGGIIGPILTIFGTSVASKKLLSKKNRVKQKLTEEEKQDAIVNAFKNVKDFFKYDNKKQQWVSVY